MTAGADDRAMTTRTSRPLLGLLLVAGCGPALTLDPELRVEQPLLPTSNRPLPDDPHQATLREYQLGGRARAEEVAELLRRALPAESWNGLSGVEYLGDERLAVVQTPAGHERALELIEAVRAHGRIPVAVVIRGWEVPWETASSLGPLRATAPVSDEAGSFLAVTVREDALELLDLLCRQGYAEHCLAPQRLRGRAGSPLEFALREQQAYVAGITFDAMDGQAPCANPEIRVSRAGTSARVRCLPLADSWLLIVEASDTVLSWSDHLENYAGPYTSVPSQLPAPVVRTAAEVVALRPGESLALVGTGSYPWLARVLTFTPVRGSALDHPWTAPPATREEWVAELVAEPEVLAPDSR
jgi:hypothetical protein